MIGIVAGVLQGYVSMPELFGIDLVFLVVLLLTVGTLFLYARDVARPPGIPHRSSPLPAR